MSKARPSFTNVPQEVMDIIAHYTGLMDLSSLSKTCKAIRAATLPNLFKDINMMWEGNIKTISESSDFRTVVSPRIDLLLRTILETPDLAEYVMSVDLQSRDFRGRLWFKPSLPVPSVSHAQLFESALEKAHITQTDQWHHALQENKLDAIVLLLLAVCPNLVSLTLGLDFVRHNPFLNNLLLHNLYNRDSTKTLCFRKLKSIRLGSWVGEDITEYEEFFRKLESSLVSLDHLLLFYAPALKNAEMSIRSQYSPVTGRLNFEWPTSAPKLAALRTLRLHESTVHPTHLQEILRCAPALVDLTYDYRLHMNNELDCEDLQPALESVKDTLTDLKITCQFFSDGVCGPELRDLYYVFGHCSFHQFPVLKSLHISPEVLLGWHCDGAPKFSEVLPPSLIKVSFRPDYAKYADFEWMGRKFIRHSAEFLQDGAWRKFTPQLERYDICNAFGWVSNGEEDELKTLCEKNGVTSTFIPS